MPRDAEFFAYQQTVNGSGDKVPSHQVIREIIRKNGKDYRAETAPNPIPALQNRGVDNTTLGRAYQ